MTHHGVLDQRPLDMDVMRASARRFLSGDAPPAGDELSTRIGALRGHVHLLIPEVESAAWRGRDDVEKYCALACVGEARRKVGLSPRDVTYGVPYARRLARSVEALCRHYESLRS